MTLKQTELVVKWIAAITAILVAIKVIGQNLIKAYKYLQESNERKEMLESILHNQEYNMVVHKAIMDKFGLAYFRTDLSGYTIEVGEKVCEIFHYHEDDLMGLNWSIKIPESDRQRVYELFKQAIEFKTDFECTYKIHCGDGKLRTINVVAKRTSNYYFGIVTDIK